MCHFNRFYLKIWFLISAVTSVLLFLVSCNDASPYKGSPYAPSYTQSASASGFWEDVLSGDPEYPANVYLTEVIELHPGLVGVSRRTNEKFSDEHGYALENEGALGPPEGTYPCIMSSSDAEKTVLGKGGWGVWRFDPDYRIIDGPGDDFISFSDHNVFGGDPDQSWNELGRVYVSEDGVEWYENSAVSCTIHPEPGSANDDFRWDVVRGLHGNIHTWANFRNDMQAENLDPASGLYFDLLDINGLPVFISRYFTPDNPYLGGDRFDLGDFVHIDTGVPWPPEGRMSFIKIEDDPCILDGQDWNPDWMLGVRIMAAMGINVEPYEEP